MDIAVPLTLETVRLVLQMLPEKYNGTPEDLYDLFYNEKSYTHMYIPRSGKYFFQTEVDLVDRQYVPVAVEELRKELFIRSLET